MSDRGNYYQIRKKMDEFRTLGRNNRKDDTCQSEPLNYASSSSEISASEELQFPMTRSPSLNSSPARNPCYLDECQNLVNLSGADSSENISSNPCLNPECSTWHKFPNPGGAISTKNVLLPNQGAGFWSNMSYLQHRGPNFNQKCHIANTCGMILAKFIIKYILNT